MLGWLLLATAVASAQAPATPVESVKLADVAWIAGHWVNEDGGNLSEEVWTVPTGGSMLGMWRYVSGGQARIYELLSISEGEGPLVFRLRHFDPKLVGREEKDRAVELKLVRFEGRVAAFEGAEYSGRGTLRLTYRAEGGAGLHVTLDKDGKKDEFTFKRR
jgi:hypothetical protein